MDNLKYALKHISGEYVRVDHDPFDYYTDDLSYALLFDSEVAAKLECNNDETIILIRVDEEGGMWEE